MTTSAATDAFVQAHLHDDVRKLALRGGPADVCLSEALTQIEGYQLAERKLPGWAAVGGIRWPVRLSLEQCSSGVTAAYKRVLVQTLVPQPRAAFADLTAGLGVDFAAIAPLFARAVCVEAQPSLVELARHNMPLLGLGAAHVVCATAEAFIQQLTVPMQDGMSFDLLFLDPARRDSAGRKVVMLADCMPDVVQLQEALLHTAHWVLVKLSPMLDITAMLRSLRCVRQVHVVSVGGECKELLAAMSLQGGGEPVVHCVDLPVAAVDADVAGVRAFSFTRGEEAAAPVAYATAVEAYLYEPGASLLKAGAFRLPCSRFGLSKLASDTHLYTSSRLVAAFPGRIWRVVAATSFAKRELRAFMGTRTRADIATRGFPLSTAELRRQLHLREGGGVHLIATTLADGSRRLCEVERVVAEK